MIYSNQEYSKFEYYGIIPKNRQFGDWQDTVEDVETILQQQYRHVHIPNLKPAM